MTKPRFTADPPISLEGMSEQEKLEAVIDWAQRQVYRIDDWWPEDFESRIAQLEALFPGAPGTWPIVDYSTVSFNPVAAQLTQQIAMVWESGAAYFSEDDYDNFAWGVGSSANLLQCFDFTQDGQGNISGGMSAGRVVYSTDRTTFNLITLPGSNTGDVIGPTAYLNGTWYVTGNGSVGEGQPMKCWSSTNLATWTEIFEEVGGELIANPKCITDGTNLYAAGNTPVSGNITFWKSTDGGLNWTSQNILTGQNWSVTRISYANNRLFITGNRDSIVYSEDAGASWSSVTKLAAGTPSVSLGKIVYGDGVYFAAENNAATPKMFYSSNLTTWASYSWHNSNPASLFFHPTLKWLYGSSAGLWKSTDPPTDATKWTDISPPFTVNAYGCVVFDEILTL